jgi:Winged helix DNA-binding domain
MRGTLHFLAGEDVGWLIGLLGPRVLAGSSARRRQLGITDAAIGEARQVAVAALSGGRRLRRAELLAALTEGGVEITGQRGYHLLWYLSQTGTLCLGPTVGGEQLFVLVDEWLGSPRRLVPEEALRELADRFFRGHGPATVKDLARWAGLRVTEARAGLAAARDGLAMLLVDDVEYFLDPETPDLLDSWRAEASGTFLLPGFDEFVLGYGDRSAVLDPEHFHRIVPGGNGMFRSTVVHQGRIVGTWGFTGRGGRRTVTATPFTAFTDGVEARIPELAAALPGAPPVGPTSV